MKEKKQKVKFPISFKLILIFTILIVAVLGLTTYMVSTLVRSDEQVKAEENNHTINSRTAETVGNTFVTMQNNAAGLFNTLLLLPKNDQAQAADILFADYCKRNSD